MNQETLKRWQIRILLLCCFAYACIYLGRNNLSIAIPAIQNDLGMNKSQMGMMGGLFLWVYGIGQLINGYLGDKVSSRIYIFCGLFITALTNILFGFATSLTVMMILWSFNSYFQSLIWGPMSKTITYWIPLKKRSFAAIVISISAIIGTLITYLLAGRIMDILNWRWVFIIPGIIILVFSVIWYTFARNHPNDIGLRLDDLESLHNVKEGDKDLQKYTLLEVINKSRLWFVIIACFAQGIVKDGINLWAPTFFLETHNIDMKSMTSLVIVIPIMNFGGMIFSGWLNKELKYQEKITVPILFIIGIFMILGLNIFGSKSTIVGAVFLGLSSAMMSGANTILLGIVPMKFDKYNKVSAIAGTLDFCSYFISGFTTLITGFIVDKFEWNGVMFFWIAVIIIGCISLVLNHLLDKGVALNTDEKVQSEV
jgi:sugar phosphate permease